MSFEAIRKASDDTDYEKSHYFKETNSSGADIAYDPTINNNKTVITINPSSDYSGQTIYLAIKAEVEDASDNAISLTESTFTTATPTSPPAVTISAFFFSNICEFDKFQEMENYQIQMLEV